MFCQDIFCTSDSGLICDLSVEIVLFEVSPSSVHGSRVASLNTVPFPASRGRAILGAEQASSSAEVITYPVGVEGSWRSSQAL